MPNANVLSWNNTQIEVNVPNNANLFPLGPTKGLVSVTASGSLSNEDFSFQTENYIDDISVVEVNSNYVITITGTGFGNDPGIYLRSTYYEHANLGNTWIANANVQTWNNDEIVVTVPLETASGYVSVTSNGYESNAFWVTLSSGGTDNLIYIPIVVK